MKKQKQKKIPAPLVDEDLNTTTDLKNEKANYLISHERIQREPKQSICTCGLSKVMPYCDGEHKKDGRFKSLRIRPTRQRNVYLVRPMIELKKLTKKKKEKIKTGTWKQIAIYVSTGITILAVGRYFFGKK